MMGLPQININFFGDLIKKETRTSAGIVALLLRDEETETPTVHTIKYGDELEDYSEANQKEIRLAFEGGPRAVIVVLVPMEAEDYKDSLRQLRYRRFDYLAVPGIVEGETKEIVDWVKVQRERYKRMVKAVLPHTAADHEAIINVTTDELVVGDQTYSTSEYTARFAGIFAGMPFTRSATYYVLPEVKSFKEIEDPDQAVDDGELILINDGVNVKIGRGVNSLTSVERNGRKTEAFKSIRAIEVMDMIHDEIYINFETNYIGKVPNIYDNQALFIKDVNRGFSQLEELQLLDPNGDNHVEIDIRAQRDAWENVGVDTADWDDQEVKEKTFQRNVFLTGSIRVVDTIEDMELNIHV